MELEERLDLARARVRDQRRGLETALARSRACLERVEAGRRRAAARGGARPDDH